MWPFSARIRIVRIWIQCRDSQATTRCICHRSLYVRLILDRSPPAIRRVLPRDPVIPPVPETTQLNGPLAAECLEVPFDVDAGNLWHYETSCRTDCGCLCDTGPTITHVPQGIACAHTTEVKPFKPLTALTKQRVALCRRRPQYPQPFECGS